MKLNGDLPNKRIINEVAQWSTSMEKGNIDSIIEMVLSQSNKQNKLLDIFESVLSDKVTELRPQQLIDAMCMFSKASNNSLGRVQKSFKEIRSLKG